MKKFVAILLICMLFVPASFAQNVQESTIEITPSFIDQAIENGQRITSLTTFEASEDILSSWTLQRLAAFLNNFSIKTTYQKNNETDYFWDKAFLYNDSSEKTLLSISNLAFADDVYLSTNLIPGQALAFTPKELATFFSTLTGAFSSAVSGSSDITLALMYVKGMIDSFAKSISETATWSSLGDMISSLDVSDSLTNEEDLKKLNKLWEDISTLVQDHQVLEPDLTGIANVPADAEATQYSFDQEATEALLTLLEDWLTNEATTMKMFAQADAMALLSGNTGDDTIADILVGIKEIKTFFKAHASYPILLTLWHQSSSSSSERDLVKIDLPILFEKGTSNDNFDSASFNLTYDLTNIANDVESHDISLALEYNKKEVLVSMHLEPVTTVSNGDTQTTSFLADFSFTTRESEDEDVRTSSQQITVSQEGMSGSVSTNSKTSIVVSAANQLEAKDSNASYSNKGSATLTISDASSLEQDALASGTTTLFLDLTDDWGDGTVITINQTSTSSSPEKDEIPAEVTRLGKMDQEKLMTWASGVAADFVSAVETILQYLPIDFQ